MTEVDPLTRALIALRDHARAQFLGSEDFAKIASKIRNAGGEYVSTGKQSHFRMPKPK